MSGSTGRVVGALVGAVAGYFTGGASYVLLGASLGSAVGGLFDKTKTEGPRLDDLKVQQSNYGVGIPVLYGTERIAPNVIWSTDKIEMSDTETQGKGGGVENTTYRYFVHMRQLLCETPRDGSTVSIVQIFQDGKLIYDARSGIPAASALASAENPYAFFTLYQGDAAQLPDPVEEIYSGGPGSVPAYRGVVSISMKGIECPGGRVPQFSFVLSATASLSDDIYLGSTASVPSGKEYSASRLASDGTMTKVFVEYEEGAVGFTTKRVRVYAMTVDGSLLLNEWSLGTEYWGAYDALPGDADIDALCFRKADSISNADSGFNVVFDAEGRLLKSFMLGTVKAFGQSTSSWSKRGDYFLISGDSNQLDFHVMLFNWETAAELASIIVPSQEKVILSTNYAWILVAGTSPKTIQLRDLDTLALVASTSLPAETAGMEIRLTYSEGNTLVMWAGDDTGHNAWVYDVALSGASIAITLRNHTFKADGSIPKPLEQSIGAKPNVVYAWNLLNVGVETTDMRAFMIAFNRITMADVKAKDIIADQCERAGELRYDVSAVPDTDTVVGYKIGQPAAARVNSDPLLTAFNLYVVDEDGVVKFKPLAGLTSVAKVSYDELGQTDGGGDAADVMPLTRTQEIDLPRSVTVSYIEAAKDFQVASETEIRQVTDATEDSAIELPLCVSSDRARTCAQSILYARWRGQNARSATVSRKFAYVSPGDGVTIEYPRGTLGLWRVMSTADTGVRLEWTLEPGDAQLFTQTAVGATGYVGQEVQALAPPTRMEIIDSAMLRDADNDAGPYVALAGIGLGYPGGQLFVDDQSKGAVENEAGIGVTSTALTAWTQRVVDETNVLSVDMGHQALTSITRDQLLGTGTENVAAVGANGRWEIIKFQRATSLGGSRYEVSGLLRGLRGTEWATGTHGAGDKFIVMSMAGTLRPATAVGEIGFTKTYKAITKGRSEDSATIQDYANTGESLKPFAPVDARKSTAADGAITLTWGRRTRVSENVFLTGALPLGEALEAWQVEVYLDGTFATVKRVLTAYSGATAVYTAADQVTDFGATQSTLYVRIYQLSDAVGRGHELQATV